MKAAEARTEKLPAGAWKVIAVVVLGPFISQMDSTVVNVSLSTIQRDLHSSISSSHWIISGYLLALALVLPLNGWLIARIGAKKLYLLCFSSFTLASALCGMAHTMPELICTRIIQGMAGGLMAPLTQYMMARVAGRQMARVIGFASVPILVAPLTGPVLAGIILEYAGWPWLFFVNVPVGISAVILAAFIIPRDDGEIQQRPFDLAGFLMISPALAGLLYGLDRVSHRQDGWSLAVAVALFAAFLLHARRKRSEALIDIGLFRNRSFSTATLTMFLANGIMYGAQFLIPFFLTTGCHRTAAQAGWLLGVMGIGMLCSYPSMGYMTEKFGCRMVASSGVLLNFLGTLPFLYMAVEGFSVKLTILSLLIRGMGQGATGIPAISAAYAAVPRESLNLAAMAVNIAQRLGGPTITTAIAIATSLSAGASIASAHAFLVPFAALLTVQLIGLGCASRLPLRIYKDAEKNSEEQNAERLPQSH